LVSTDVIDWQTPTVIATQNVIFNAITYVDT
jgi:hypothetical protein